MGAGILVVDPGPSADEAFKRGRDGRPYSPLKKRTSRWSSRERPLRLLRAYVIDVDTMDAKGVNDHLGGQIVWRCGEREGSVFQNGYGMHWITGHGPQARGALLAQRALERHR